MLSRLRYSLLVVAAVVFPVMAAAQTPSNDIGVWVSTSQFDETRLDDPDVGDVTFDFDEDLGYGVTYTRFFGNALAVELGAQRLSADATIEVSGPAADFSFDAGSLDLDVIDATLQWHFARGSRFSPYVGAGAAYVTGEFDANAIPGDDEPATTVDLDNETTWLANAGVNVTLTKSLALGLDAKYIAYDPKGEGDSDADRLDVNPLVISAGLRFRF